MGSTFDSFYWKEGGLVVKQLMWRASNLDSWHIWSDFLERVDLA